MASILEWFAIPSSRMPKNWSLQTVVLEKTPESPLDSKGSKPVSLKSTLNTHWQDWCWRWSSSILVIWSKQPTHWKSPWYWERLRAEGEEGIRGRDGWVASPVQWTWTWADFRRWWGTGTSGMPQSMGLQRIGHDWATEQQRVINTDISVSEEDETQRGKYKAGTVVLLQRRK